MNKDNPFVKYIIENAAKACCYANIERATKYIEGDIKNDERDLNEVESFLKNIEIFGDEYSEENVLQKLSVEMGFDDYVQFKSRWDYFNQSLDEMAQELASRDKNGKLDDLTQGNFRKNIQRFFTEKDLFANSGRNFSTHISSNSKNNEDIVLAAFDALATPGKNFDPEISCISQINSANLNQIGELSR